MGTTTVSYKVTKERKLILKGSVEDQEPTEPVFEDVESFLKKHKYSSASMMALAVVLAPVMASAEDMGGGKSIILLLQQASFWVGMGITIWGIVEAQLDFPGWRGRIVKGVLGYIGILLVPLIFIELQNSLQVDVWTKIDEEMNR